MKNINIQYRRAAVPMSFLKYVPVDESDLNKRLENYILVERPRIYAEKHKFHQDATHFSASTVSNICLFNAFMRIKEPTPFPMNTRKTMLIGDIFHSFVQDKLYPELRDSKTNWVIQHEVPITPIKIEDFEIGGHPDIVHWVNRWIMEIKTTAWISYGRKELSMDYLRQIHVYMKGLGIDKAYVPYIQKNDFDIATWEVDFSDDLWEIIANDACVIRDCFRAGDYPPRTINKFCKTRSSECVYYDICHKIHG